MQKKKPIVAFVCVHNSCRSQISEALGTAFASDVFESVSAGTQGAARINPDAVRLVQKRYGIDMTDTQHPKLLDELPAIDVLVKMGCNVACPHLPARHTEDWGLDDPSGQTDEAFEALITTIEQKVKDLKDRLESGRIL